MTIEVKNCKSCPFSEYYPKTDNHNEYANCLAPINTKYNIDSYYKNYKSPKWCPLKQQEQLIIKFKK